MTKTNVKVKLVGEDGNALSILSKVTKELRDAGYSKEFCEKYQKEAMAGDYNELLYTTLQYVEVESTTRHYEA